MTKSVGCLLGYWQRTRISRPVRGRREQVEASARVLVEELAVEECEECEEEGQGICG